MIWWLLAAVMMGFILFLNKKRSFKFGPSPKKVEIKSIKGLKKLSDDLDRCLSKSYIENVEDRVRRENKLKENEFDWRLLDLKRYFIMTTLLKDTPMFSEKVDELWHEMLMFTREYEDFSKKYYGTTLHHAPNIKIIPDPDLRGFFDWIYAELFYVRKENIHLYNGFFRHPVHPSVIDDFKQLSEDMLISRYFRNDDKYIMVVLALISSMKRTANRVRDYDKHEIHDKMRKSKQKQNYNKMLVPYLCVSYYHYYDFTSFMKMKSSSASSCTSCGSAGSSCSSSSCSSSSCGSSCSSCGGGGD